MIKKLICILICFFIFVPEAFSQENHGIEQGLIRLEEGQKALNQRFEDMNRKMDQRFEDMNRNMNQRFEAVDLRFEDMNHRLNDIMTLMIGGFGILFTGMFTLMGFVLWDRRTTVAPVVKKVQGLEDEKEAIIKVLQEYARVEPKMREVLTNTGYYSHGAIALP